MTSFVKNNPNVVVEEDWSWESSNMINDVIRRDQSSKNFRQHSITLSISKVGSGKLIPSSLMH